jgi:hypothetical protein
MLTRTSRSHSDAVSDAERARRVAKDLDRALRRQGVQFRRVRLDNCWSYVIDGRALSPFQAAQAYLPGGWWAFYAPSPTRGRRRSGGGR